MTTQETWDGDVRAGQKASAVIGEAVYDRVERRWEWAGSMYELLGVADDGRDPQELVFERMHPADRPRVAALLAEVAGRPAPFAGQYRLLDDAGRERAIAFLGTPEVGADGGVRHLRGMAIDVTDAVRRASSEAVAAATSDRAAIEQVKGALMFAHGLDADAAFGVLSRLSQQSNVKVAVLARTVAERLARPTADGSRRSILAELDAAVRGAPAETGGGDLRRRT